MRLKLDIASIIRTSMPTALETFYDWLEEVTLVPSTVALATSASSTAIPLTAYTVNITTVGNAGQNPVTVANGSYVGQRVLVNLATRTDASDTVNFTMTNIEENLEAGGGGGGGATALVLDAAGEFVLLEWAGAKWNIVYTNGTLTT